MTTLILSSWTACSQTTLKDSLCFSKEQAAQILKDIKRGEICDSIAQNQGLQIVNFKTIVRKDQEQKIMMKNQEEKMQGELNKTKLKLKATSKIATYGIPGGIAVGILVGILVAK